MDYSEKKIIIADLDGTLSVSKNPVDVEMAGIIAMLLQKKALAVISGGSYAQYQKQFLPSLPGNADFSRLYLFPTCATAFYRFNKGWEKIYSEALNEEEKKRIFTAFDIALRESNFDFQQPAYGDRVEDRTTQVTFSAYGQWAPFEIKSKWDPDQRKRIVIVSALKRHIPEFDIRIGGTSSIDVTRKGIDKEYGIRKIMEHLGFKMEEMVFIGDALFEGGNDYPAKAMGLDCIQVLGPEDTKRILRDMIAK